MKRILVIDDEPTVRQAVSFALKLEGFETVQADNGQTGVDLARKILPELVLCDVRMAIMDGYATLAALRQDPITATIPFIFMTAHADKAGMRQAMAMGADDYLAKPFSVDELLSSVRARLEKQKALSEMAERKLAELRANISLSLPHELLTPLNGILGFAELMRSDAKNLTAEDTAEMADQIHQCADDLLRLIQNYLIYAQIELVAADPRKIESLRSRSTAHAHEVVRMQAIAAAASSGRTSDLNFDLGPGDAAISEDYLRKIVNELAGNGCKFSPPGAPIKVSTQISGDTFLISISDQGRGMSPDQVAGVGLYMQFERRFHAQSGLGLGLILARRLAELHGGSLVLESEPGKGTIALVRVPLARAPAST